MIRNFLLAIALLMSFFPFAEMSLANNSPEGVTVTKSGSSYVINFRLPQFDYQNLSVEGEDFFRLRVGDYGTTSEFGLPELPIVSFNIPVPYSQSGVGYKGLTTHQFEQPVNGKVYPFQQPWEKVNPVSERPFTINRDYYNSRGSALPFIKISEPFVIGGVKGVTVTLQPFSYNPVENKLTVIDEGNFVISFDGNVSVNGQISESMNSFLSSIFVAYENTNVRLVNKYLIITAPEFEAGLASFVNHKNSSGYNVDLFTTTVTGTTTTAIKTFIQNRYDVPSTKPDYILLVGDVDKIPAWTGGGEGNPKTDLNYAQLEGGDYFADAFLGRFSVTSASELQNAINKTIYMENYIGTLAKKNVYMSSEDNWSITEGTHNFVIDTYFTPAGYTNLKLYSHTYSATTAQLIAALNDNQVFAIYSGHGAETYWADGPVLNQTQVRALTNTVFPYVYSFACVTGSYTLGECFGETWLRTTNGGSAFYGSSVNSYWDEDDILERRLYKAMFEDELTKITPMFDKGKVYLYNHYGSFTPTIKRYFEMYNLMGDPSLATVKQIPPDSTAPLPVTDLAVVNPTSNDLTLNWTAPYDSTFNGVTRYDIRYSTSNITNEIEFNNAPQILFGGQADTAGTPKVFTVPELVFNTQYYFAIKAEDMWGNKSTMSNVPFMATYQAPDIACDKDSVYCMLLPNVNSQDSLVISNVTSFNSTLDYSVELTNNTFPGNMRAYIVPINEDKVSSFADDKNFVINKAGSSIKGSGGPDLFGYEWIDSDDPNGPDYVWNDIVATGTQITNWVSTGSSDPRDDGVAGPFPLGFNFKFYGNVKTQIYVYTNGIFAFEPITANWYSNTSIPTATSPNSFIAPFWDDLDGRTQGTVHYKQDGNKFIIQFTNWQKYSGTGSLTFQAVFNLNGKVQFYYQTLTGTLNSCTVGIENDLGTDGLQVVRDAAYLKNNHAIEFAAEPDWLAANNISGRIYNGNNAAIILNFMNDQLELGLYSMDMVITTNDPDEPTVTVPVVMNVTNDVPVELSTFSVKTVYDEVILSWQTATEKNNSGFEVQRSINNGNESRSWQTLSFVDGKGTTTQSTNYSYRDQIKGTGKYVYRLKQIDFDGTFSLSPEVEVDMTGPDRFELVQNYPNPFNPTTTIKYALPVESNVTISVYNLLGELVETLVNKVEQPGYFEVEWNASNLSSGMYIYSMQTKEVATGNETRSIKKMVLMK
ncbi:MAG: T9SS type A sorting domain-containing protein [Ignavibacteriales bacterium]|nr:MAG: T9SS type A sorting domain-containing protein [Ignavibacteriales bacterium]